MARTRPLVIATAALAGCLTLVVSVLEAVEFGYRSPSVHVAIETAASVVAVVAAYLFLGRFRSTRRLDDLLLFAAMLIVAVTNVAFSTAFALAGQETNDFSTWAQLVGRVCGGLAFAAAAFAPARRVESASRGVTRALGLAAGVAVLAAIVGAFGGHLATGIDPDLSPAAATPRVVGSPGLVTLQLIAMLGFAAAAAGFTRRAERSGEELLAWIAAGLTLAAFSRLNYFLFPSIFSNYVYVGDVLRLAFYLVLLVGAVRAIGTYQRAAAQAAAERERRRMARDLHDGLAQELAFISMQVRGLASRQPEPTLQHVANAAERALDESRAAISTLSRDGERSLVEDVEEAARTVASRGGARVRLALDSQVEVPRECEVGIVRIVREAITNAVRHGGAKQVAVKLERRGGVVRLEVDDDGTGFDPSAPRRANGGGGFGLQSMRERAAGMSGELEIRSAPGEGTTVALTLPRRTNGH